MSGQFAEVSSKVIAKDIVQQWKPGTRVAKQIAVKAFFAFMSATGVTTAFFPENGSVPTKTTTQTRAEEHCLCQFAMLRLTAGQSVGGIEGTIAHIRTWYRVLYEAEFGKVGDRSKLSMTSQYLKSVGSYWGGKDVECKKRDPVTWNMCKRFMTAAKEAEWWDVGVAIMVAFTALFRMGELTNSTPNPYDWEEDMAEEDVTFLPTFWTATKVVIQLGRSKADQSGMRAKLRPRILPVDRGSGTAGWMLHQMLVRRYGLREGTEPSLSRRPLFQNRRGGQLRRDAVLTFMRAQLKADGYTPEACSRIGTHSCRIGGATRLFQLGASADVFKCLGGWVSDAYKAYIIIRQADLMVYARRMCGDEEPDRGGLRMD